MRKAQWTARRPWRMARGTAPQKGLPLGRSVTGVAVAAVAAGTMTGCGSQDSTAPETPTTTVTKTSSSSVKPSNTAEQEIVDTQHVQPTRIQTSEIPTVTVGTPTSSEPAVTTVTIDGTPVVTTLEPTDSSGSSLTASPSQSGNQWQEPLVPTTLSATTVMNTNQGFYTFTNPTCDGHYILVVGNYIPSGAFSAEELNQLRAQYPGAMVAESGACGSLAGESYPIYFDYGWSKSSVCSHTISGGRPKVAGPAGSADPC